jgi:hypothetical protein
MRQPLKLASRAATFRFSETLGRLLFSSDGYF